MHKVNGLMLCYPPAFRLRLSPNIEWLHTGQIHHYRTVCIVPLCVIWRKHPDLRLRGKIAVEGPHLRPTCTLSMERYRFLGCVKGQIKQHWIDGGNVMPTNKVRNVPAGHVICFSGTWKHKLIIPILSDKRGNQPKCLEIAKRTEHLLCLKYNFDFGHNNVFDGYYLSNLINLFAKN